MTNGKKYLKCNAILILIMENRKTIVDKQKNKLVFLRQTSNNPQVNIIKLRLTQSPKPQYSGNG